MKQQFAPEIEISQLIRQPNQRRASLHHSNSGITTPKYAFYWCFSGAGLLEGMTLLTTDPAIGRYDVQSLYCGK